MDSIKSWQQHRKNTTYQRRWLIRAVTAALTCLLVLAIGVTSYAEDPSAALIVKFQGNQLNLRSGTNRNPIPVKAGQRNVMENSNDVLFVPGDNSSNASFALAVTQVWEFGGLLIDTIPSNMPSQYTFPCKAGGRLTIGWRPQGADRDRACNQGATVGPVRGQNALLPLQGNPNSVQAAKNILKAQANDEVVVVPSDDQTVIQTADTGNGITVDVIEGDVNIKSAKNPQGRLVKKGERYSYPQDTITPINRNDLINSPAIRDFLNPDNWLSPEVPPRVANGIAEQLGQHRVALGLPTQPVASSPRIPASEQSTASSPRTSSNLSGDWVFDFGWVTFDPSNISGTCRAAPERGAYQGTINLTQNGNQLSVSAPPEVPMISAAVSGNQFEAGGPVIQWRGTVSSDGNKITGTGTCGSASLPFTMTRRNSQSSSTISTPGGSPPVITSFTCNGKNSCKVKWGDTFSLSITYTDEDGNANSWQVSGFTGSDGPFAEGQISPEKGRSGSFDTPGNCQCTGRGCSERSLKEPPMRAVITDTTGLQGTASITVECAPSVVDRIQDVIRDRVPLPRLPF